MENWSSENSPAVQRPIKNGRKSANNRVEKCLKYMFSEVFDGPYTPN
jgi:hypothetical protein